MRSILNFKNAPQNIDHQVCVWCHLFNILLNIEQINKKVWVCCNKQHVIVMGGVAALCPF